MVLVRTAPYFRVFTRDGEFVKAFGDEGLFESAHSVTIDAQGFLWVTDSAAHLVHKFSPDGRLLMTLGKKGVAGDNTSRDLFNQPNHVAIAPNGDIYVSDGYVNARVVHFSKDGQFVRIIGGVKGSQPGQLQLPHGVALDSRGRILINDSDNQRVSIFDKDGKVRRVVALSLARRDRRCRRRYRLHQRRECRHRQHREEREAARQRVRRSGARDGHRHRWLDLCLRRVTDDGHEDHEMTRVAPACLADTREG